MPEELEKGELQEEGNDLKSRAHLALSNTPVATKDDHKSTLQPREDAVVYSREEKVPLLLSSQQQAGKNQEEPKTSNADIMEPDGATNDMDCGSHYYSPSQSTGSAHTANYQSVAKSPCAPVLYRSPPPKKTKSLDLDDGFPAKKMQPFDSNKEHSIMISGLPMCVNGVQVIQFVERALNDQVGSRTCCLIDARARNERQVKMLPSS